MVRVGCEGGLARVNTVIYGIDLRLANDREADISLL